MVVCGGGGVEGGRIRRQNGQIHEFEQHINNVLLVRHKHSTGNKKGCN